MCCNNSNRCNNNCNRCNSGCNRCNNNCSCRNPFVNVCPGNSFETFIDSDNF